MSVLAEPYINKSAIITIPDAALQGGVRLNCNCNELIEDLSNQLDNLKDFIECFLWISNKKVRVTFLTSSKMEDFITLGTTFKTHPLVIEPYRLAGKSTDITYVNVLRLAYGIPNESLSQVLSKYRQSWMFA